MEFRSIIKLLSIGANVLVLFLMLALTFSNLNSHDPVYPSGIFMAALVYFPFVSSVYIMLTEKKD